MVVAKRHQRESWTQARIHNRTTCSTRASFVAKTTLSTFSEETTSFTTIMYDNRTHQINKETETQFVYQLLPKGFSSDHSLRQLAICCIYQSYIYVCQINQLFYWDFIYQLLIKRLFTFFRSFFEAAGYLLYVLVVYLCLSNQSQFLFKITSTVFVLIFEYRALILRNFWTFLTSHADCHRTVCSCIYYFDFSSTTWYKNCPKLRDPHPYRIQLKLSTPAIIRPVKTIWEHTVKDCNKITTDKWICSCNDT